MSAEQRNFFQKNGYLLIENALSNEECETLKNIIDTLDNQSKFKTTNNKKLKNIKSHNVHKNVFENYPEVCLNIFQNKTVLHVVKTLISSCGSSRGSKDTCLKTHVIHNNAFKILPGNRGQAQGWHTDDAPIFIDHHKVGSGRIPDHITVAPLALTCMYYLNDIRGEVDGMTHIIPGSHRYTSYCTQDVAESMQCLAPAVNKGTLMIISPYLWHRGAEVKPEGNPRYLFQVTYGRRLVGHKFKTIMDYHLPTNVKSMLKTDEEKELMGYLQGGAYS